MSLKLSIFTNHAKSSKHVLGKEALVKRELRERDIAQAMKRYGQEVHPIGETLPEFQRVFCVKVRSYSISEGQCSFNKVASLL